MEPTPPVNPQQTPAEPPLPTPPPPPAPNLPPIPPEQPVISQTVPRADTPPPPAPFTPVAANPGQPVPPAAPLNPGTPPSAVMVGDGGLAPVTPINPAYSTGASPGGKRPKKLLIGLIAAAVLIVGGLAWYFGYYMNSSVIYGQSLKNTGKGYDKLVTFVDNQQKIGSNGYTGNGSYKIKYGGFSTDGKIAFKSNSDDSDLTFDVGLDVTRLKAEVMTIKGSGDTPDVYVKASDIQGLGTVVGLPDLDAALAKINDTWIVIDHTLIDNLDGLASQQANASTMKGPTRDQLLDEARAFGKVNQQYLFSTSKNKAVTKVVKSYGAETVDGRKTYHYKIALQKDNVKSYIYAQRDALKNSKLNDWLKQNKYDKDVYSSFNDAAVSTKDIKSTDTYDIWMDAGKRIVYKVRFSDKKNPADNYVDVGLNYKGGDTFPFFVNSVFNNSYDKGTISFVTTLNTKTSETSFNLNVKDNDPKDPSNNATVSANFSFKPSTSKVKISKPANAMPLSQVLSELGYGDLVNQLLLSSSSAQATAQDTKRQTDIQSIQTQLEVFFQNSGYYPSLKDMNDSSWLAANMKTLDRGALTDPSGNSKKLAAAPAAGVYSYAVTDSNGNSCENDDTQCAQYTLTATLSAPVDGSTAYTKSNLD